MNKGLIGIERALILHTLIQDKSSIMIRPEIPQTNENTSLTLHYNEYQIYPQGIIFFKKFFKSLSTTTLRIIFYHKGRPLCFINDFQKFQNGYGIIIPQEIFKLNLPRKKTAQIAHGKIYFERNSQVHATCSENSSFPLFENSPWLNFAEKQTEDANYYLQKIANIEKTQPEENIASIMRASKLLLYPSEKKIQMRDFFPYPVTITANMIDTNKLPQIEDFIAQKDYQLYIPFCESKDTRVHSIFGLKSKNIHFSPIDIAETLIKISICKYFAEEIQSSITEKSKPYSLDIIALSHSNIALGIKFERISGTRYKKEHFPLQEGKEYTMTLTIPVGILERFITVKIYIKEVFTNGNNGYCALCLFNDLKEEDRRFLYENFTKTKLS